MRKRKWLKPNSHRTLSSGSAADPIPWKRLRAVDTTAAGLRKMEKIGAMQIKIRVDQDCNLL